LNPQNSRGAAERIADTICIFVGYFITSEIVHALFGGQIKIFPHGRPAEAQSQYSALLILAILSWLTLTAYTDIYGPHRTERLNFLVRRLIRTSLIWSLVTIAVIFALKFQYLSRQFTVYFIGTSIVLIFFRQLGTVLLLRSLRRSAHKWRTAVVIGDDEVTCRHFAGLLGAHPMGYQTVEVQSGKRAVGCKGNWTGSGCDFTCSSLDKIDDVYLIGASDGEDGPANARCMLSLLKQCKSVHIVPSLLDTRLFRQSLGDIAGIPVLSVSKGELNPVQAVVKRAVDFVGSSLLLIVLSPVMAAIAVAIKLTSPGPALFRQRRLGLNGKPFTFCKFRTMRADAEQILKDSPALYAKFLKNNFKLPKGEDPRLAPLGSFLRATSLDELPQLFNVFRGEMSLVGPRPVEPEQALQYGDLAMLFMSAKPGMTGHWQVSGRSEIAESQKRVEMELEYIRDQSLGKDFEILLRTVPAVLRRKGAH
jgi:exopolysaccharide biosynthesis polyprenyl glycosylphosphotransferase